MLDNTFEYDNNLTIRENMVIMFENESRKYRKLAVHAIVMDITEDNKAKSLNHLFNQHFYRAFNNKGIENLAHAIILKANK